ncbi:MAG TPA: hypothetical protein VH300_13800 [Thermoleophilaceae bacterium]|nr:hypothetical protein [Thermoleophilaceae bacterium]
MAHPVTGTAPDELHSVSEGGPGLGSGQSVHLEVVAQLVTLDGSLCQGPEASVDRARVDTHESQPVLELRYPG